jgi:hypothetical protein
VPLPEPLRIDLHQQLGDLLPAPLLGVGVIEELGFDGGESLHSLTLAG